MPSLTALHINAVRQFLDECIESRDRVDITAMTTHGAVVLYTGWLVIGSHFRGGTHRLKNPVNGQIRSVPDILIFTVNNHPVYL